MTGGGAVHAPPPPDERSSVLSHDPAGISTGYGIGRDIPCDNASRSDHHIVPDGNARHENGAAPDPYIIADGNLDERP